ncbi:MAG: DNA polymerase III subunit delta [Bacteroidota bacterium]
MKSFDQILTDIKKRDFQPVYLLHGEEPYFIDAIEDQIEGSLLSVAEKEFNQSILYGSEIDAGSLIDQARRYPMFSDYQLIIVREAQKMRQIEQLEAYAEKPVKSTILVLCHKYKKLDGRTRFAKNIDKNGVVFESKKLYDNLVPAWITAYVKAKSYNIEERASQLLAEYIGTDLSRITQEFTKLTINIPANSTITVAIIEKNVGISKEFNIFELSRALGERDVLKSNKIASVLGKNPKENPLVKIVPILFNYFTRILLYKNFQGHPGANLAGIVGVPPIFLKEYANASGKYPIGKLFDVISILREYDLKNKGVGNESADDNELLKEMIYKILH